MTFAYIAVGTALLTAAASVRQGQAVEASANYQAQQEEQNAIATTSAANAQEDVQREKARQAIGTQLAAQAQSGAQLNGSAADLLKQSLFNAETDARQIRYSGETQSSGLRQQASATRLSGRLRKNEANISALGSLSSAAGQAYGIGSQSKINAQKASASGLGGS